MGRISTPLSRHVLRAYPSSPMPPPARLGRTKRWALHLKVAPPLTSFRQGERHLGSEAVPPLRPTVGGGAWSLIRITHSHKTK